MLQRLLFTVICYVVCFSQLCNATRNTKSVMPWMCLERCGMNSAQISESLDQINEHLDVFNKVSFEMYNLGRDGELVLNNLTNVVKPLKKMGVKTYAMVSSFPYPPDFITYMRYVFQNSDAFIEQTIAEALKYRFTGYNCDWEPPSDNFVTDQDAADYADFLTKWAKALHAYDVELTVDVATWSRIWNITLIGQSEVDRVITMSTYTSTFSTFQQQVEYFMGTVSSSQLGIGMENDNYKYTDNDLKERFDVLNQNRIMEIDLWLMPIPDIWFPFLEDFVTD